MSSDLTVTVTQSVLRMRLGEWITAKGIDLVYTPYTFHARYPFWLLLCVDQITSLTAHFAIAEATDTRSHVFSWQPILE